MVGLSLAVLGVLAQAVPSPASHVLIIAGVGGEAKYAQEFYEVGKQIADAARTKYGVPDSMVTLLAEQPERDSQNIRGPSTKFEVEKAFATIRARAKPGDLVFVVLIGHGSSQGPETSMFNLVDSPDMDAADFKKLLSPLSKQEIAFVNMASASGDFIEALAGKNRVVATSTMSPMERNYVRLAKHFAAAYSAKAADADVDKNGLVSLLEAFNYARAGVEKEYKSAKLIQSEHARLEDNGDGEGTEDPDLAWFPPDGRAAARIFPNGVMPEDPKTTALIQEREALMAKLLTLYGRQAKMDAAAYERELQEVLVDLVIVSLRARQVLSGGKV